MPRSPLRISFVADLVRFTDFYGYDSSVHLAEETKDAQLVVAKGMWLGTLATWLISVPTLILILMCMPSFTDIIAGSYSNNWAVYVVELLGPKGAVTVLFFTWLDGLLGLSVCLLSCQRVTYAIARDDILPGSKWFKIVTPKSRLPVNAALLIIVLSIAINATVIGSEVAFGALTATATIAVNVSYLIPIMARQTIGRQYFEPAKWNLGRLSPVIATVASLYICFLFCVLILPQEYPVGGVSRRSQSHRSCQEVLTLIDDIELCSRDDRGHHADLRSGMGVAFRYRW